MTVANTLRRAGPLTGNGTVTAFPFSFKVYTKNDITVYRTTSAGVISTLVLDSDYSVSVNANQNASPGGTVTYPITGAPLPAGDTLTILGNLAYSQITQLPAGGAYNATNVEDALDRNVILAQQLLEATGRTLQLPPSAATVSATLPAPIAANVIGWNATGTALQNYDSTVFASTVQLANWQYQTFLGDGTTVGFALAGNPIVVANMDVTISGVTQVPIADYNLFGTTLTFTTAPPMGAVILVRYGRAADQQTYTHTTETVVATASQTVFTLTTSYVPGANNLTVYANGLRLRGGVDYLETDANTVTFTTGAQAGDEITFDIGTALNQGVGASSVSFLPGGVGAVARNAQDKMREVVSVLDFGADPLGVNDSTAAIQAAINSNPVKVIEIPAGTYKVSAPILLRDGITLRGAGRTTTILSKANYNDACLKGIDVDHVTLSDFAIVGPGQAVGPGPGVANKGILIAVSAQDICTSISLARIDVSLVNDICVYVGSGAFCTYDSIRCRNYGYCGIFIDGGDGHALYACTARGGGSGGLVGYLINRTAGYGPTTVTMTGCYAEQAGRGIVFNGAVSCVAIGCGVEAAINFDATHNGTNWLIAGGSNVSLINCLSRNDTIGAAITAPHVLVNGSATQVLIDGFTRENSGTFGPPTWELDISGAAANGVTLGRNNFTVSRINPTSGSTLRYSGTLRYESAVQTLPAGYGGLTVSHGGSRKPDIIRAVIRRNSTAGAGGSVDASYATGDEVDITDCIVSSNTVNTIWASATQLGYGQVIAPPNIAFKTPAGVATANNNVSTACWGLVFYAYWF